MRQAVDQYQIEIRELRRQLARLQAAEAEPDVINEYEAEVRLHSALYRAAQETLAAGDHEPVLRRVLDELGFGEWTLDSVYSFVYEAAMELPDDGDLAARIDATDFADSLRNAAEV
ncbi:MAG: FCD domain-containing protein [Candidatus Dormibacteraeota bacterium]|nr:FCD domain-containing protein [Candidatus Dormibacteraeota bacterium]MBV8444890.1 FCD domain-containing protein [Candidatus Dormibacteraeota bacterium]